MKCHTSNRSARWGRRLFVVNERLWEANVFNYVQICLNILNYGILSLKKLGLCCVLIEFVGCKTYASNCTAWIQNWWKLAKIVDHFSHSKTVAVCIVSYHLIVARHLWLVEFLTEGWQWLNFFNAQWYLSWRQPFECSVLWGFFWGLHNHSWDQAAIQSTPAFWQRQTAKELRLAMQRTDAFARRVAVADAIVCVTHLLDRGRRRPNHRKKTAAKGE